MKVSITIVSITIVSIMIVSIMIVSIMIVSITTFSIMIVSITTVSTMGPIVTLSINVTEHSDFRYTDCHIFCLIILCVVLSSVVIMKVFGAKWGRKNVWPNLRPTLLNFLVL
jgi:hypothetical protein